MRLGSGDEGAQIEGACFALGCSGSLGREADGADGIECHSLSHACRLCVCMCVCVCARACRRQSSPLVADRQTILPPTPLDTLRHNIGLAAIRLSTRALLREKRWGRGAERGTLLHTLRKGADGGRGT